MMVQMGLRPPEHTGTMRRPQHLRPAHSSCQSQDLHSQNDGDTKATLSSEHRPDTTERLLSPQKQPQEDRGPCPPTFRSWDSKKKTFSQISMICLNVCILFIDATLLPGSYKR